MRIVHVIRDLAVETGGPVRALRGLSVAQARLGHDVTIQTTNRGWSKLELPGVRCVRSRAYGGGWAWSPDLLHSLQASMGATDIVHIHMMWDFPVLAASFAAAHAGVPFILRPCGQLDRWSMSQKTIKKRAYLRAFGGVLSRASSFHYTTAGEQANAVDWAHHVPSFVVPVGIDVPDARDIPSADEFERLFPSTRGKQVALFLGRLHPKKQPDVLIKAFAKVWQDAPNWHLVLAGPGAPDYVKGLAALASRCGIAEHVTMTGALQGRAVQQAYHAASLFVLASHQENFGIAIAEAMLAGCPVIISDKVDLAREIAAADAGLVCPGTVEDIYLAIRRLATDEAGRAALSSRGRAFVLSRYTWERVADATLSAYSDVLNHGTRRLHHGEMK